MIRNDCLYYFFVYKIDELEYLGDTMRSVCARKIYMTCLQLPVFGVLDKCGS